MCVSTTGSHKPAKAINLIANRLGLAYLQEGEGAHVRFEWIFHLPALLAGHDAPA